MQTGGLERRRVLGEQDAVGRHGQVADPRLRGQHADEARQVAAQQRLAAGQAHLVHAEVEEHVGQRGDLAEVQDVLAREPDVLLLRHAVAAAEVAAIGDRDAQVAQHAAARVEDGGHQAAPAGTASAARARSHSRRSPAFFTPTSK